MGSKLVTELLIAMVQNVRWASARDHLFAWAKAGMILDGSEVLVRDLIERELLGIAGLDHVTIGAAQTVTKRLMDQISQIRTQAIKTAFRVVRSRVGDELIHGQSLATWAAYFVREDLKGIDNAIRTGLIQGLNNLEIARKVVGSMGLNGVDGVTEYTRHKLMHLGRAEIRALTST